MEPPSTRILNTRITCKKIKYFVIRPFNKYTVVTKVKKPEINDSVVLAFLECICYSQDLAKKPVSQICIVPFSNFGNGITFGPLRMRCLFYI